MSIDIHWSYQSCLGLYDSPVRLKIRKSRTRRVSSLLCALTFNKVETDPNICSGPGLCASANFSRLTLRALPFAQLITCTSQMLSTPCSGHAQDLQGSVGGLCVRPSDRVLPATPTSLPNTDSLNSVSVVCEMCMCVSVFIRPR